MESFAKIIEPFNYFHICYIYNVNTGSDMNTVANFKELQYENQDFKYLNSCKKIIHMTYFIKYQY